jgi:hypothetical protein
MNLQELNSTNTLGIIKPHAILAAQGDYEACPRLHSQLSIPTTGVAWLEVQGPGSMKMPDA